MYSFLPSLASFSDNMGNTLSWNSPVENMKTETCIGQCFLFADQEASGNTCFQLFLSGVTCWWRGGTQPATEKIFLFLRVKKL